MKTQELRNAHSTRPFQPFSIRMGNGQSLPVPHPEFLSYSPKSRVAVVFRENGSFEIVDLLLMTGLEVHRKQNGKRVGRGRQVN